MRFLSKISRRIIAADSPSLDDYSEFSIDMVVGELYLRLNTKDKNEVKRWIAACDSKSLPFSVTGLSKNKQWDLIDNNHVDQLKIDGKLSYKVTPQKYKYLEEHDVATMPNWA